MKKWTMAAVFVAGCAMAAHAGILKASVSAVRAYFRVGSTLSTSVMTSWGQVPEATQSVAIAASTNGQQNCLSFVSAVGTSTTSLRVLDGGTTIYATAGAANAPIGGRFNDEELCGSANQPLYILVSTAARSATVDMQAMSYSGYSY
jgi:hypothetical protein